MGRNNSRYEYKFVIRNLSFSQLEQLVLVHPLSFTEIFSPRWINNIYYDTSDLTSYGENSAGVNERTKYRIRWYGEDSNTFIDPILELKFKKNKLGWKKRIPLNKKPTPDLQQSLGENNTQILALTASVQNRYKRTYYLSSDEKFRITIDQYISHRSAFSYETFITENKMVLEVKFDKKYEEESHFLFSHLPLRQSKNSKYSNGIRQKLGL